MNGAATKTALIRADASLTMGSGHVMRMLTLALALAQKGFEPVFACRLQPGHLKQKIETHGFACLPLENKAAQETRYMHSHWLEGSNALADAEACVETCNTRDLRPTLVVVDHYALGAEWEARIKQAWPDCTLLAVDDLADRPHACELLLDQNPGRNAGDYAPWVPSFCKVLAGPSHALLRKQFEPTQPARIAPAQSNGVLVCMGGADPDNLNLLVLHSLKDRLARFGWSAHVVAGQTNPNLGSLSAWCESHPQLAELHVDVGDMASLMRRCKLAVGAGGVMALERCAVGLPSITVAVAENQMPGACALERLGAVGFVSSPAAIATEVPMWFDTLMNEALRKTMAHKAMQVCDGLGTQRVVQAALELCQ
ncbi:MAG TPA: UDP-2,4-diacetamido-2,4,6-trideoxy-beta-L-altropyranose hydrolase [Limnobacter sp.]|nr:UDP-2,4-diacetamido-2,4,6-trideoxy-beta-L-altropyranose hydrolase [Limnobacter sp.]